MSRLSGTPGGSSTVRAADTGAAPAGPHYLAGGRLAQENITTGLQAAVNVKESAHRGP